MANDQNRGQGNTGREGSEKTRKGFGSMDEERDIKGEGRTSTDGRREEDVENRGEKRSDTSGENRGQGGRSGNQGGRSNDNR